MLARVAERIYWLSRYMERAESTARLVNVYTHLLLDLPKGTQVGWETLIDITGGAEIYPQLYDKKDERNVLLFLLANKNNPSSIFNSLQLARENGRTTREIFPTEAWEMINDLYLYVKSEATRGANRNARHGFVKRVIQSSQQLTGLLAGCMSHTQPYDFVLLGRNLERADMTSRIVDVGVAALTRDPKAADIIMPYENTLWMSVLRSLNGYQMYRQHVHDRVNAADVVRFLLRDEFFPRTVLHCLNQLTAAATALPNHEECLRVIAGIRRRVQDADLARLMAEKQLYDFIDQLQLELAGVHESLAKTWFLSHVTAVAPAAEKAANA